MSIREGVRATIDAIDAVDPSLGSYVTVAADQAVARAERLGEEPTPGPLRGMCVSVKDNIATAGIRTTAGSLLLEDNVPDESAPVVTRLERAGAIVVGKAHMNELGFGGQQAGYGVTRNPWSFDHSPGGSSNGSAAGVAAGLAESSIGTDTAGSVRQPAAFCGVVGFKPSRGEVPVDGVVPLSFTLDHVGIISRSAATAARVFDAVRNGRPVGEPTERLACAVVRAPAESEPVAPSVDRAVAAAAQALAGCGIHLCAPIVLPELRVGLAAMNVITRVEAALCHWDLVEEGIDRVHPAVRARLRVGRAMPASHYARALRTRRRLQQRVDELFRDVDLLLMPAVPFAAPPARMRVLADDRGTRSVSTASCTFLALFNVTGHPAIVLPAGLNDEGLPLSVQLVARMCEDDLLLRVAAAYQDVTTWHTARPPAVRPGGALPGPDRGDRP